MDILLYTQLRNEILKKYDFTDIKTGMGFSKSKIGKELFTYLSKEYPEIFPTINDLRYFIEGKDNPDYPSTQFCRLCGKRLKVTHDSPTGYNKYCSIRCKNKALVEWCENNKEQHRQDFLKNYEKLKKWRKDNPERVKENLNKSFNSMQQWMKANPEKVKENRAKGLEALSEFRKTDKYQQVLKICGENNYKNLEKWRKENPEAYNNLNTSNSKKLTKWTQKHIAHTEDLNENFIKKHFIKDGWFLPLEFQKYFNLTNSPMLQYKKLFHIKEPNKFTKTIQQNQLVEYCATLDNVVQNTRSVINPYELDIYIPDCKLAIEYDGLMFHSFGKSKYSMFNNCGKENKRIDKLDLCKEKGIHLLTIRENEWNTKQDIWKSVISSHLGKNTRIFARKCKIKEVPPQEATKFLKENHLQGALGANIRLGLYHNDELVSLMTFGKSRFTNKYEYELLRYCNKKYINVTGGASKLLKHFEKTYNPISMVSYANKRWSDGNLYKQLGFEYKGDSKPTYYYFHEDDLDKIYSRVSFQKHKLKEILPEFNPELSEKENMYNNGYRRIYDCGNMIFTKTY